MADLHPLFLNQQLNKISEQNKKLESQSRSVQARLDNLQVRTQYPMCVS